MPHSGRRARARAQLALLRSNRRHSGTATLFQIIFMFSGCRVALSDYCLDEPTLVYSVAFISLLYTCINCRVGKVNSNIRFPILECIY